MHSLAHLGRLNIPSTDRLVTCQLEQLSSGQPAWHVCDVAAVRTYPTKVAWHVQPVDSKWAVPACPGYMWQECGCLLRTTLYAVQRLLIQICLSAMLQHSGTLAPAGCWWLWCTTLLFTYAQCSPCSMCSVAHTLLLLLSAALLELLPLAQALASQHATPSFFIALYAFLAPPSLLHEKSMHKHCLVVLTAVVFTTGSHVMVSTFVTVDDCAPPIVVNLLYLLHSMCRVHVLDEAC